MTDHAKPLFLGVYFAPGVFVGSDMRVYRAYLDHLRALTKPKTGEAHQMVRAWAIIQWRLQCLTELEQDWWLAYEQGVLAGRPSAEDTMLDMDPMDQLQVCQRAINAWDKLQRMERRLQREAARLLPLLETMMADDLASSQPASMPSAVTVMPLESLGVLDRAKASGLSDYRPMPSDRPIKPSSVVGQSRSG